MKKQCTQRHYALLVGISLVVMTIVAGLSMGLVFQPLLTMNSDVISSSLSDMKVSFYLGLAGWIIILITDVLVSWGLIKYFQEYNRRKAFATGILRMSYSAILAVAILQLFRILPLMNEGAEASSTIYHHLHSFYAIWQFGLIIFGVHLLTLAPLVWKKSSPRLPIAILIFVAGIGYILSSSASLFVDNYYLYQKSIESIFMLPMVLGEFGLAIWMIVKGGKPASRPKQVACEFC